MKLGDTVQGEYHGEIVTGIVGAFDGSGFVHLRLSPPVVVYGVSRDQVCFDRYERKSLKVIVSGPELDETMVGEMPHDCIGGSYLKRK